MNADERPLVVTLALEEAVQARFDEERRRLFPPGRTAVGAHLTLFHALPGRLRGDVERALAQAVTRPPVRLEVVGVLSLGRGVAYDVRSDDLLAVHAGIRRRFTEVLTRQDAQPLRPHVTVQNKVDPQVARATAAVLGEGFCPFTTTGTGLQLWRYDGGPWARLRELPFRP